MGRFYRPADADPRLGRKAPRESPLGRNDTAPASCGRAAASGGAGSGTIRACSHYPMTVARRVARNFAGPLCGELRGADVTLHSDLPPAAGLSSSSALIVGTFLVLSAANRLDQRSEYAAAVRSAEDLAGYLGTV